MVNQAKTLERLNKEKNYEERLAKNLSIYCLQCLKDIKGLSKKQIKKIEENISIMQSDSLKHEHMINKLIEMVIENGENTY